MLPGFQLFSLEQNLIFEKTSSSLLTILVQCQLLLLRGRN
uniref:Uncharacterized protein n=1 Tax=Populus trichocarpa TaxID=3694 RepID=A9PGE9_POPTR|nr:unknown [Populus trichocarpa]